MSESEIKVPPHLRRLYESAFPHWTEDEFLRMISVKFVDIEDPNAGRCE